MAATDRRRALSAAIAAILTLLVSPARADEASGSWTGVAEARGNYYWETSTRVVAPAVGLDLVSPKGVRVHGDYLVDTITSASVAAGTRADVAFTEVRHEGAVGGGYELDFDDWQLELTGTGRVSYEPDYLSSGGLLTAAFSLNQRTTVLRLSTLFVRDRVEQLIRGAGGIGGNLSDRGVVGHLNAWVTTLVWDQVLSPVLTAQVGYDFGYLTGYLQNPYRLVPVGGIPQPENHPDERFRHSLTGRLAYYIRPTHTAVHAIYRAYVDSWDIAALTPEVRIYQELGELLLLRLKYRYYTQTESFFYEEASDYTSEDVYVTADPKMSEFRSSLLGVKIALRLGFFEDTFLHFARQATVDLNFEYIWRTNRYGDGVIAQVGVRLPF